MSDALPRSEPYPSFDAFFTRPLRDGARSPSADAVVSPADGTLVSSGPVDPGARLFVKGRPYDVADLVGDPRDAPRYAGGQFAVVYLAPRDYHRVHSPVDGRIDLVRSMPGDLFPVNRVGERHVPRLLVRNQRVAIYITTEGLGRVAVVMVGAVIVGRISVRGIPGRDVPSGEHMLDPPLGVNKGDEIGVFHLGSTVVLLLEPGTIVARPPGTIQVGATLLSVQ